MVRRTSTIFSVGVTFVIQNFEFHFILLQVKKAQFGHFKKYGVNPKKKMKSFLVTRNALLHPGKLTYYVTDVIVITMIMALVIRSTREQLA